MSEFELRRPKIVAALARASRLPVTLVVAPAGSGKTMALRRFAAAADGEVLCFEACATHTTLTRFVRGLADALALSLPKVPQSLAIAHERATHSTRPADVLAAWLAEHLRDRQRTIVVDNFHRCEHDSAIAAFLAGVIDRTRAQTRWIVATRVASQLPFAKWFARGDVDVPIDAALFALTREEARTFCAGVAPALDLRGTNRLYEQTKGSIGYLRCALATVSCERIYVRSDSGAEENARANVDELLAVLEPAERRHFIDHAMLASRPIAPARTPDRRSDAEALDALRSKVPQAFERGVAGWHVTPFFTDLLTDWLAASGSDALAAAHARAARALEGDDRIVEALGHDLLARDFGAISRLIEEHGLALADAGFGDVVQEAIDALDPIVRAASPVILAIRATFDSRLGRFDAAESGFGLALGRATERNVHNGIAYQYGTHLLRFKRPEAIALLETLVRDTGAADDLQCYAMSALGPAYVFARRNDEALASAASALRSSATSANRHLRARVLHQAAFVALCRDEGARATFFATQSLEIAREQGFFDIAAAALTVLYNVASDLEDDPVASLRFLDEVAECAAKSGSLSHHSLALVAKLEIQVERGDAQAVDELDGILRTIDSRFSGSETYEALVASQAIRAGWNGDYAEAYRLLIPSTEQQWSADRKALRWAEVAVYAAAGGMTAEAASAIRAASELIGTCQPAHRIVRARLFLALALVLCGRSEPALEMLTLVDADPHIVSPRLVALRRALGELWDRFRGARNHAALLDVFDALRQQHFGGIARLILNFPLTDNASLRLPQLSLPERRIVAILERREGFVSERQMQRVLAKLGCIDIDAALRALARRPYTTPAGGHDATAPVAGMQQ